MRGNVEIKIKYSEGMEPIKQAHEGEWYDLRCAKDTTMWSGDFAMISLGVAIELPEGFEAILAPRSSTFKQYGIIMTNSIGVIDNLYCGDDDIWHFPALKVRGEPVTIHKNERIGWTVWGVKIVEVSEAQGLSDRMNDERRTKK